MQCDSLIHNQGFSLANNSEKSMYDVFAEDPARAQRFAMFFSHPDEPSHLLLENYHWEKIGSFVDVGGSHGSIAISIAERFPGVKCIVQDLPDTITEGRARLPSELKDRVDFMAQ
jgi:hypothetical protein